MKLLWTSTKLILLSPLLLFGLAFIIFLAVAIELTVSEKDKYYGRI